MLDRLNVDDIKKFLWVLLIIALVLWGILIVVGISQEYQEVDSIPTPELDKNNQKTALLKNFQTRPAEIGEGG